MWTIIAILAVVIWLGCFIKALYDAPKLTKRNVLISALYGVMAPVCIVLMLLAMFFDWISRKFEAGEELIDDWADDLDEYADYD